MAAPRPRACPRSQVSARASAIYLVSVLINPGKTVTAVTLPAITNVVARGGGSSHVFAVGIGGDEQEA